MKNGYWPALATMLASLLAVPITATAHGHNPGERTERATSILEAMDLPIAAHQLRQTGMSRQELRAAIQVLRESEDSTKTERASRRSARILRAEAETAREHGPMEGFGTFVRAQVEAGVRGQDLARAIRENRQGRLQGPPAHAMERKQIRDRKAPHKAGKAGPPMETDAQPRERARERLRQQQRPDKPAEEGSEASRQGKTSRQSKALQRTQLPGRQPPGETDKATDDEETEGATPAGSRRRSR